MCLIYMYKQDLALNNRQMLLWFKTQQNKWQKAFLLDSKTDFYVD